MTRVTAGVEMARTSSATSRVSLPPCRRSIRPTSRSSTLVQRQTLRYFWDFAHPACGLARERSNVTPFDYGLEAVTTGGTGFGVMAIIVGAERGWITRAEAVAAAARACVRFLLEGRQPTTACSRTS